MLDRKEEKRREHRRKKYKFALVQWYSWDMGGPAKYALEHKENIKWKESFMGPATILCDDQPERVLRGMLKLLVENGDE